MSRHLIKSRGGGQSELKSDTKSRADLLETKSVMFDESQFIPESPGKKDTANIYRKTINFNQNETLVSESGFWNRGL